MIMINVLTKWPRISFNIAVSTLQFQPLEPLELPVCVTVSTFRRLCASSVEETDLRSSASLHLTAAELFVFPRRREETTNCPIHGHKHGRAAARR